MVEQQSLVSGEIAVTATGKTPAVASNGTNFLVVWDDGADLKGVRIDKDGTVLDATALTISNAAGEQKEPQVASNGTDYLVVWADPRNGDSDIYGTRVTSAGVVSDPTGIEIHRGASVQDVPHVASNGTDYAVVWESHVVDHFDAYVNRVAASNGAVQDGGGLAITNDDLAEYPTIGALGTSYYVVWSEYRDHAQADLYGSLYTNGSLATPSGTLIAPGVGYQGEAAIASNGTSFLVAFADTRAGGPYDIYAAHVSASGTPSDGTGFALSAYANHQDVPTIASNGIDYFAAWNDARVGFDVYGNLIHDSTVSTTDGFGVATSAGTEGSASVAYDAAAHGYLIAYQYEGAVRARLVKQCGDGVLQSGEACDDGNMVGGDGCSAVCGIESGFTCSGSPSTCADINECLTNNGGCQQTCANSTGSFACGCNAGYQLTNDEMTCVDRNECLSANGGCAQTCTNSIGSFSCSCEAGYTLANDGLGCDDVDECSASNGGCAQTCDNVSGGYSCACAQGYTLDADAKGCSDVDECLIANGGCSETCANSVPGFACSCASTEGLADDGHTCITCPSGTVGNGTTCDDIDECSAGTDTCTSDQKCNNTVGSFTCEDAGGCGCHTTDPRSGALLVVLVAFAIRRRKR